LKPNIKCTTFLEQLHYTYYNIGPKNAKKGSPIICFPPFKCLPNWFLNFVFMKFKVLKQNNSSSIDPRTCIITHLTNFIIHLVSSSKVHWMTTLPTTWSMDFYSNCARSTITFALIFMINLIEALDIWKYVHR